MASIQSTEVVLEEHITATKRLVRVKFTALANDNTTTRDYYVGPEIVGPSFDVDTWMQNYRPTVLAKLAREEEKLALRRQDIADPLDYAQNPLWSTFNEIGAVYIAAMLDDDDPRLVIWLEPFILYVQANFSAGEIAGALGITTDEVVQLNNRANKILNATGTLKDLLAQFDSLRRE